MHDMDFPPGFGPDNMNSNNIQPASGFNFDGIGLDRRTSSDTDPLSVDIQEICESVEDSLYLSAKTSFVEYLGDIINREVAKIISAPETDLRVDEVSFILVYGVLCLCTVLLSYNRCFREQKLYVIRLHIFL